MTDFDTTPLPPRHAAATRKLLADKLALHPFIRGMALSGSFGMGTTPFPGADVDINFFGEAERDQGPLPPSQKLRVDGVDFHFASRYFDNWPDLEVLGWAPAIVAARWHVLWERDDAISGPRAELWRKLGDADWAGRKLDDAINAVRDRVAGWDADLLRENARFGPLSFLWEFAYTFSGLLSPVDLRGPSLARKGLLEIVETCELLDYIPAGELALRSVGVDDVAPEEARAWLARGEELNAKVEFDQDGPRCQDHTYYLLGARHTIQLGRHREAIYPLWQCLATCLHRIDEGPSKIAAGEALRELGTRLGFDQPSGLETKLAAAASLTEFLAARRSHLLSHMQRRVAECYQFARAKEAP